MRLGWGEIRGRAKKFSQEWAEAHYEKGETQSFYNDFFEIFGVKRRQVAVYEKRVEMIERNKRGFIDLFWPGNLIIEQKSAGRDLLAAQIQAFDYFDGLPERDQPKFILACDFQRFKLLDLDTRQEIRFTLPELHKNVEAFAFILGRRRSFGTQAAVNIKAAELMGRLHDALEETGYTGHDLERLLVRLLFCLFADDTGIFEPKDIFLNLIDMDTKEDGSDVGNVLMQLFDLLDTPENQRQSTLRAELLQFPYINGALFTGHVRTPGFNVAMREMLLDAARFDWGKVSPAIFGSLFQSVMDAKERRKKGAHYTTETNILKVIGPLFLDDLKAEFEKIKARHGGGRVAALKEFQHKLARLTFLDPACGCGNFLVIAYRELRALEMALLGEIWQGQTVTDISLFSLVTVDQFYGIEFEEFPARIAEVAMWMMDHIANNELSLTFGQSYARIPLKDSAHIVNADALEMNWNDLLPHGKCSYIMGNPPFIGQSFQSPNQREQMARVIAAKSKKAGSLDYVTAWFIKAGEYIAKGRARIAFVSTNSITQGEQVAQLWPILFDRHGLEIAFAHRTFEWGSEAHGKAHVHVVIIGLTHRDYEPEEKRLFSYPNIKGDPVETRHAALTAYLFDATRVADRHLVVSEVSKPLNESPIMRMGSKIVDGGHLIFDDRERQLFLEKEPCAARFMAPLIGSQEYIRGESRWILALQNASPDEINGMPQVLERIKAVRDYRLKSKKEATRKLADYPTMFEVTTIPKNPFLVVPKVSSERRNYVPIGWLQPPHLPTDLVQVILEASLYDFAILTSHMHMAWLNHIGGRLKSDYRYSIGLVYNTFPWPGISPAQRDKVEALAQAVLDARAVWTTSSLADLYDPDTMPANLRAAHGKLDAAVDKLYRPAPFASDRDRVEHLFGLYEKMINPLGREAEKQIRRVTRAKERQKAKTGA